MSKPIARARSRSEREAILSEFVKSGRTQRAFCLEVGIALSTLQYWLRHAAVKDGEPGGPQRAASAFVEVKVANAPMALARKGMEKVRTEYDVVLRSGQRLVVRSGFAPEEVAVLVDLLEAR